MKQTSLKETLTKWQDDLADINSVRRPTIERFAPLNTKKIAKDLKIEQRAHENGSNNLPAREAKDLDEVEKEIVQVVREEINKSRQRFEENQKTYEDRFYRMYHIEEYGSFETEARNMLSEYKKDVDDGLNQLQIVAEPLKETADERRSFRTKNKLDRTAHYPDTAITVLRWGLIAVLFLVESLANANFLAKGSDYGLIGGWVEAIAISFMNIGFSVIIGLFVLRELWHRKFFRKLWGLFGLIIWLAFTLVFNLLVAHYREQAGIITEISSFVFAEFVENPFGINEFQSWMLFGIGSLFAVISLLDALKMDDLYPFYGKLNRKYEKLRLQYMRLRSGLIERHTDTRTDLTDLMSGASQETIKHSNERKEILVNCKKEQSEFEIFLKQCNQDCNHLLNIYRVANIGSRGDGPPDYFNQPFQFEEIPTRKFIIESTESKENTERFQSTLEATINEFFDTFDDTTYPPLSEVTKETNGETATR